MNCAGHGWLAAALCGGLTVCVTVAQDVGADRAASMPEPLAPVPVEPATVTEPLPVLVLVCVGAALRWRRARSPDNG